jgi:ABC-type multidrug transport system ATPase subunit
VLRVLRVPVPAPLPALTPVLPELLAAEAPARRVGTLRAVSGTIDGGSTMAIMGESGSGKTTLLHILAGQRLPTSGDVLLDDAPLDAGCKRYIGMVPQVSFAHILSL